MTAARAKAGQRIGLNCMYLGSLFSTLRRTLIFIITSTNSHIISIKLYHNCCNQGKSITSIDMIRHIPCNVTFS